MENKNEQELKAELETVSLDDCVLKDVIGGLSGNGMQDIVSINGDSNGDSVIIDPPPSPDQITIIGDTGNDSIMVDLSIRAW